MEVGHAAVPLVHVVDDVRRARVVIEDQLQVRVRVEDLADRGVECVCKFLGGRAVVQQAGPRAVQFFELNDGEKRSSVLNTRRWSWGAASLLC